MTLKNTPSILSRNSKTIFEPVVLYLVAKLVMIKCLNAQVCTGAITINRGAIGAWPVIVLFNHEYGFLKSQTQLQATAGP